MLSSGHLALVGVRNFILIIALFTLLQNQIWIDFALFPLLQNVQFWTPSHGRPGAVLREPPQEQHRQHEAGDLQSQYN